MWSLAVVLLLLRYISAEIVTFQNCPVSDDDPAPVPNCTINEVRISPCVEALENLPCQIKRGRSASIQFDFTPTVGSETLTGKVYWVNQMGDLPFVGMNSDACTFTTCPIQPDRRQTYEYQLSISKRFPVRAYDIKWRLWNEDSDLLECCFITKIKLTKK